MALSRKSVSSAQTIGTRGSVETGCRTISIRHVVSTNPEQLDLPIFSGFVLTVILGFPDQTIYHYLRHVTSFLDNGSPARDLFGSAALLS